MKTEKVRSLGSLIAFLVPLVIYALTLCREIYFTDCGELAAVAATLGIAHPPGYPLFTLLGHLFALMPISTVAFRVGFLSALSAAGAALLLYRTGLTLTRNVFKGRDSAALVLAPLSGALLWAFADTVWGLAVIVEVYTLQALLLAAFLAVTAKALERPAVAIRYWPLATLLAALSLTNHLSGALLLPSYAAYLLFSLFGWWRTRPRGALPIGRSIAAGILPLLLYLYLPIRSRMHPAVCWDVIDSWHRFWVHVSARQYHGMLGRQGLRFAELKRFAFEQLPGEATWLLLILALFGLIALLARRWRFAVLSILLILAHLLYNMAYPIHDIRLYYIPVLLILGVWAAAGSTVIVAAVALLNRMVALVISLLLALSCTLPLRAHWSANDQSEFTLLAYFARDTLKHLEPNAVIFSGRWDSFTSPAIYYQNVEHDREDVLILDQGRLSSPSLAYHIALKAPDLAAACQAELAQVVENLGASERGLPLNIEIARFHFAKLKRALVEQAITRYPTYHTRDMTQHPMFAGFAGDPQGLAVRLYTEDRYRPYPVPEFDGQGTTRARLRRRIEFNVYGEWGNMLRDRARYLERYGRDIEARAIGEKAAAIDR